MIKAIFSHFPLDLFQEKTNKGKDLFVSIGDHILATFFNDDIDTAFSKGHNKTVSSFNIPCEHPDLKVSRQHMVNMVKVAVQERFFRAMDKAVRQ